MPAVTTASPVIYRIDRNNSSARIGVLVVIRDQAGNEVDSKDLASTATSESVSIQLAPGQYASPNTMFIVKGVGFDYDYVLSCGGQPMYADADTLPQEGKASFDAPIDLTVTA